MSSLNQPSPRVARKRARAREHILDAARQIVHEQGFERLTIESIAERADISKPAVYYYFASKEDVARALLFARAREEVAALLVALETVPPGASVVTAIVRAYVQHHLRSPNLFRAEYVWAQIIGADPQELDASVNAGMIELFSAIESRLEIDRAAGRLHEGQHLRRVTVTTWMAAHGLMATVSLLDSTGTSFLHEVEDIVHELCGVLTRGVYRDAPHAQT